MRLLLRVASIVLLASASMACAGVQARTIPDGPPLEVPPPPSLVDAPFDDDPEPPVVQPSAAPSGARPARRTPPATAPKPVPPRSKADTPDKTESPSAAPAKPAADAAPPAAPAVSLQTTTKVGELEQKIRGLLARATRDLGRIDVRTLDAGARAQYDEAKRFAEQAEAALKVKNLAFAEQLADKAATLAELLAKR